MFVDFDDLVRTIVTGSLVLALGCDPHDSNPTQPADVGGKADDSDDVGETITVGGVEIPRLTSPGLQPLISFVQVFVSSFTIGAPIDNRYSSVRDELLQDDPVRMGSIALLRPGLGNIAPSAGWVTVVAQHFDTVVVMYTQPSSRWDEDFRRITEIDLVSFPEGIDNVYAIGSPIANLISFPVQSDLTLQQLDVLAQHAEELGADPLDGEAWVFAHSQGVNDILLSDARLRFAGLPGFSKIIAIAGAVLGGRLMETPSAFITLPAAGSAGGFPGLDSMIALAPNQTYAWMNQVLQPEDDSRAGIEAEIRESTDLAVAATINPFFPGFVRPMFYNLSFYPNNFGWVLPNDGFVDAESATLGRQRLELAGNDHVTIIEDPAAAQAIIEHAQAL
jgi:hypothetical protein